jgi:hypothetical protein
MRNLILFCTILFVIAVSMCIGVPRMNPAGAVAPKQAAPVQDDQQ